MNIKDANSLSSLPANSAVEGRTQSLPENGAMPEDFSNALMGQIELLSEASVQADLPVQPQTINNLPDLGDLLKHKGGEEELAALFDKYLPASYKKNEAVAPEATLLALTDALKSIVPGITPDDVATAQNMSAVMASNGLSFVKPQPENETVDPATLLALTNALKSIMPSITPDDVATAQNMSAVMASNGLSFVQPQPAEEVKLNMLGGENVVSGDILQKESVLRQSIQSEQGFNLQALENAGPAEKMLVIEKKIPGLGIEQAAPGVTADMATLHKPVDNRIDLPAITRPLTHPGWSKDLGEQIVWMNNKAIPAAEIKLNPEHLGPISVRIDVNQDQATITFTAQHANVKEAIEASIPKLREMLATQQLNLVNVNISQNSTSNHGRSQSQTFSNTPENREQGLEGVADIEKTEPGRVIVSKGLLSLYA